MAKTEVEKPNKRNIEYLLKRELGIGEYYRDPEYLALNDQINKIEAEHEALLKKNKKYVALKKKRQQVADTFEKRANIMKKRVAEVRREYYAKGLTPAVLKKIEKLVDDYNKSRN